MIYITKETITLFFFFSFKKMYKVYAQLHFIIHFCGFNKKKKVKYFAIIYPLNIIFTRWELH